MCLAIPSKVLSIKGQTGRVDFGGVTKEISLCLLNDVKIGDYVIIHAGYALEIIDEDEANETLSLLKQITEIEYQEIKDAAEG